MQTDILLKRLQTFEFLRGLDHETVTFLLKHRDELLPTFNDRTFENFERLFENINKHLKHNILFLCYTPPNRGGYPA
jgi:hypothetical protein